MKHWKHFKDHWRPTLAHFPSKTVILDDQTALSINSRKLASCRRVGKIVIKVEFWSVWISRGCRCVIRRFRKFYCFSPRKMHPTKSPGLVAQPPLFVYSAQCHQECVFCLGTFNCRLFRPEAITYWVYKLNRASNSWRVCRGGSWLSRNTNTSRNFEIRFLSFSSTTVTSQFAFYAAQALGSCSV